MKKVFLCFLLILACLMLVGCVKEPANVKRIGVGHLQYENGVYFVEINTRQYVVTEYVYSDSKGEGRRTGAVMDPVEGMLVTCFQMRESDKYEFIAGDLSKEYLEEYFELYSPFWLLMGIFALIAFAVLYVIMSEDKPVKIIHADR